MENEVRELEAAAARAQARMAFLLALRGRGVHNVDVLRALETAPRESFVPRRHADLAWRDIALPIACGQTMPEPYLVARMMEALDVRATHRALEVGAGSGYATAILAQLAGEVISFERYRSLAVEARTRLEGLGLANARIEWGDGLEEGPRHGPYDRILLHGALDELPESLVAAMAPECVLVMARADGQGRRLVRLVRNARGFEETGIVRCRLGELEGGRSALL